MAVDAAHKAAEFDLNCSPEQIRTDVISALGQPERTFEVGAKGCGKAIRYRIECNETGCEIDEDRKRVQEVTTE